MDKIILYFMLFLYFAFNTNQTTKNKSTQKRYRYCFNVKLSKVIFFTLYKTDGDASGKKFWLLFKAHLPISYSISVLLISGAQHSFRLQGPKNMTCGSLVFL